MVWKIIRSIFFVVAAFFAFSVGESISGSYNEEYANRLSTTYQEINESKGFNPYENAEEYYLQGISVQMASTQVDNNRYNTAFLRLIAIILLGCAIPTYLVKKKKED